MATKVVTSKSGFCPLDGAEWSMCVHAHIEGNSGEYELSEDTAKRAVQIGTPCPECGHPVAEQGHGNCQIVPVL